jgi:MoaA/NifB/PqqE/SkfB family radical SAM enzyme
MNNNSYTAANSFPSKVFRDQELMWSITRHKIILPRHVQLSPTNKCNLNCKFCSCGHRDKSIHWSKEDVVKVVNILKKTDTKGVTITGGGEPLLFPYIADLFKQLNQAGISIGLVTNGVAPLLEELMPLVRWVRFSFSDERSLDDLFYRNLYTWYRGQTTDLAFSYVLTDKPDLEAIANIVCYANCFKFTHVRIVSDILNPETSKSMDLIKEFLGIQGIDDSLVIYQPRNSWVTGTKNCYISLLKPMIYSDGFVYPCCGAQYALAYDKGRMPEDMRMGHYTELSKIIKNQEHFNGEVCSVCYYENYNLTLGDLLKDLNHLDFV